MVLTRDKHIDHWSRIEYGIECRKSGQLSFYRGVKAIQYRKNVIFLELMVEQLIRHTYSKK